jgi:hypothetical protein
MTLMYYVDLISFLENLNKEELKIRSEKEISPHIQLPGVRKGARPGNLC